MNLSAIIIAKNAEEQIADAIGSVEFADELIVVDNGSQDRTVEVAKYFKAKVLVEEARDFSKLRNLGLREAKGEWIIYIDSDERVSPELAQAIKSEIRNPKSEIYKLKRKNFYLGNHEWPYIERLERLFRRDALKRWRGQLHESPVIAGGELPAGLRLRSDSRSSQVGELDGYLLHYTHRSLSEMLAKTTEWSKIEAELRFSAGHPRMTWWRFFRVMATAFFDSYIKQEGWKIGTVGLIESIYQSFSMFVTYARLWEMQQEKAKSQNAKVKITT